MGAGILDGHPDDWWDGHDWDVWWARLAPADRARLLELGWGDEPAPLPGMGIALTSLRGATVEVEEPGVAATGRHTITRQSVATDAFLIFLDEKRAAASDRPR